jgi:hypothetical protein
MMMEMSEYSSMTGSRLQWRNRRRNRVQWNESERWNVHEHYATMLNESRTIDQ